MAYLYTNNNQTNYSDYDDSKSEHKAKYGLPKNILFCQSCVISNQRPSSAVEFKNLKNAIKETIHLNENNVCDACNYALLKKKKIDWIEREKELGDLCDKYRRNDGRYDCVVPGSGGKDSIYASHILKYKYNMNPVTVTWAPHIYTDWGWKNFQAWINAGFDNILHTPNGKVHRLLTRLAVEELFHPFQPFMLGQKNIAPKIAINYEIPLVFYGENEAEYGNKTSANNTAEQNNNYFTIKEKTDIYLSGVNTSDLISDFGLSKNDIEPYLPIDLNILHEKKIDVQHLGYYLNWHPQECYYYSVENSDFKAAPERSAGTYSKYNSIDDKMDDLHYYTLFIKYGIGRATYDASQEIRNEEIDRNEGKALIKKFDGEFPERFINEIFEYLSIEGLDHIFQQSKMDLDYFKNLCDKYRSPHIWKRDNDKWLLRKAVWHKD